uniref:Beta-N-acetylhexosaminidase n=1 Tax=Meloidogyne javanica TaxID=6303 RepID=A0A915LMN7_MELJA
MLDPKGNYTLIHEPNEGNKNKNILNRLCRSLNKSITNIYVFLQQNLRFQLLKRIIHLDLKGAAPRPEFLFELFPFFARLGFNAVLMEYEDMFPYTDKLSKLARHSAYNAATIRLIEKHLNENGLELIPLVQTFGHMEFVLKHSEFASLSENVSEFNTICPSNERSIWLIRELLTQVSILIRKLHPTINSIHLGCDEAWHIAEEKLCKEQLVKTFENSKERLKLDHITRVARIAKDEFSFERVYTWNDMFDKMSVQLMKEFKMGELLIPIVWGYIPDVTFPGYFPDGLFERLSQVFEEVLFASAFKGANGIVQQFADVGHYTSNLASYKKLYYQHEKNLSGRLSGMVLTGWQRYSHVTPLCELLPIGLPTMVAQSVYLQTWSDKNDLTNTEKETKLEIIKNLLGCQTNIDDLIFEGKKFPRTFDSQIGKSRFPGADLYKQIEEVRVLLWKLGVLFSENNGCTNSTEEEQSNSKEKKRHEIEHQFISSIRPKIEDLLLKYFYKDTVAEWLVQHRSLCDFVPMNGGRSLQRYDIIS